MNEWISVKDRLPENNKKVLVHAVSTTISGTTIITVGGCDMEEYWFLGIEPMYLTYPHLEYQVTHWMPLPEPPKEEK